MAEDRNVNRFSGEYMVQDRNHLSDGSLPAEKAKRGGVRQSEQGQAETRQQGAGDRVARRHEGEQRRQAH